MDLFGDILGGIDKIVGWVGDAIGNALGNFFGKILYYITTALCSILKIVYSFFTVFSGQQKVSYDGRKQYLINIFFGNERVTQVYWGMAAIAFLFIIVMTIFAVIKKTMDFGEKEQRSFGNILMTAVKSVLTIALLSVVMTTMLNLTNVLVDRISYLFDHAGSLDEKTEMEFTDEQRAAMGRIYHTIGNYSLNPSYNSRYNLNSCYNEIRGDLALLQADGVFSFYYDTDNGKTWQSELLNLAKSADPTVEMPLDDMNSTDVILLDIMETMRTNKNFYPVESVKRKTYDNSGETVSLDRIIFLMGTLDAANNKKFNEDPSVTDGLRGPFYYGEQSIYSMSDVQSAFDVGIGGISYLMIVILVWFTLKNLATCILTCIARIFTLLGLYIVAPPVIATMPLDNGEKFKQWTTSAIVQMFNVFGCIIPMRLVILFIPMVLDNKLVLFDSPTMNLLAKALLIVGAIEASNRFSNILTGILANNAGFAAVNAGDMRGVAQRTFGKVAGAIGGAAKFGADATGLGAAGRWAGGKIGDAASYIGKKGGLVVGSLRGAYNLVKGTTEGQIKSRQEAVSLERLKRDEKQFADEKKEEKSQNRPIPKAGGGQMDYPADVGEDD